jgi:hypothetical protein
MRLIATVYCHTLQNDLNFGATVGINKEVEDRVNAQQSFVVDGGRAEPPPTSMLNLERRRGECPQRVDSCRWQCS